MTEEGKPPEVENPEGIAEENPPEPQSSRWAEKSKEELIAIAEAQDKQIGEQSTEVGQLRTDKSDLENKLAFKGQFENPQPEPNPFDTPYGKVEEKTEEVPTDYWTNPRKYHAQWSAEDKQKEYESLQKRDAEIQANVQKAQPVIEQAKKETPHLFKGLTNQEMSAGVYTWLANKWMPPHQLGDVAAHRRIATWLQGEKTGYTFNPSVSQGGVSPTTTEPYVGDVKPEAATKTPVELDTLGSEFLRHRPRGPDGQYKDTEEEFKDKIRETQRRK